MAFWLDYYTAGRYRRETIGSTFMEAETDDPGCQLPEQDPDQAAQYPSPNHAAELADPAPYPTRMRLILGLSLLSWLLLIAGIIWLIRLF